MKDTKNITIKTYNDFVKQLTELKNSEHVIMLSFYKYCWEYEEDDKDDCCLKTYDELVSEVLEEYGLEVCKVTKDLDIIVKFKKQAEAIINIKPRKLDLFIHKL